jgi:lipopolysaccharide/colanic/teichoic acid biosynthesis glycosyltransferase
MDLLNCQFTEDSPTEDDVSSGESSLAAGCRLAVKRAYDLGFSFCGLMLLSPLFLVVAALIKLGDGGTVFYRQTRVGLRGRLFSIWKFRTMVPDADRTGPFVTEAGDARITRIGRFLRRTKLDELPQLWNVFKGEMSLVGPRPEVPRYLRQYTPEQRCILNCKPGITDLASLCFRDEEILLRSAARVEEFYLQHCVPRKVELNLEYARNANLLSDTWVILQTICPYWVGVLSAHGLVLALSFWWSCLLVYNFALPPSIRDDFFGEMSAVVTLQLGCLIWRKQSRGVLSYFSFPELRQVTAALGLTCLGLLGLEVLADGQWLPRNLILVNFLLTLVTLSGFRLLLRFWREFSVSEAPDQPSQPVRVGIVGAGKTGSRIARELMAEKPSNRTVVAFFDDDSHKWQRRIHEIPVVGMPECLLNGWAGKVDEVIIATPTPRPIASSTSRNCSRTRV